jgi:positive regulator of sigma E activity
MECVAEVIELKGKKALLRAARLSCADCGACGLFSRGRDEAVEFTVDNALGARPGDKVVLSVPSRKLYFSYLLVFALPVLAVGAAYALVAVAFSLAGRGGAQGPAVIAAVAAGLAAFWGGIKLADRLGLSPAMVKIAEKGEEEPPPAKKA